MAAGLLEPGWNTDNVGPDAGQRALVASSNGEQVDNDPLAWHFLNKV
jgi:hypothetical protein